MALQDISDLNIDKALSTEDTGTPLEDDVLLAFRVVSGVPQSAKHYAIKTLIQTLGKVATDAEAGAVAAEAAVEQLKSAIENAISAFSQKISSDNQTWDAKVSEDLGALQVALNKALAAIGQDNNSGARGAALTSIQNLYDSLVESMQQLASNASKSAQDASGFANTAVQKASEAHTSETNAEESATLAQRWANDPENSVVANGEYSAKHYAAKAGTSATAASESATNAGQSAQNASDSATQANNAKTDAIAAKGNAEDASALAEAWATKTDGTVDGTEYSAKKYALQAKDFRDEAQGIVGTSLTPDRVLVSNAEGKFSASDITTAILNYLSGLNGNVQTQLNRTIFGTSSYAAL